MKKLFLIATTILIIIFSQKLLSQQVGYIAGTVVDAKTGDALIGARVMVKGTSKGGMTKVDGGFRIQGVPVGEYAVTVNYVGYQPVEIQSVVVKSGEVTTLSLTMQDAAILKDEIVVTAEALQNTEASLLKERQKSISISDAISSEMISKTGSSNVADAMEKVTGVTIVDGKNILVRGLGDRYMNTQLNGATLPSADPDKNSVSTDIFSSRFIDNIVTVKSFTPDKPGNFTGGAVDIKTKSFPDQESFVISLSGSYNNISSLQDNYLTYDGGDTDWIGLDDGSRSIPSILKDYDQIPTLSDARFDAEKAQQLNDISEAFISQMAPTPGNSSVNQGFGLSYGNQFQVGENQAIGLVIGGNYSSNYSAYNNGTFGQYQLTGKVSEVNELMTIYDLQDSKGTFEANWGGMANVAYSFLSNHKIGFNMMINNSGEKTSRYLIGYAETLGDPYTTYETRSIIFVERYVESFQFNGEHQFKSLFNTAVDWNLSANSSNRNEPNQRFFVNDFRPFEVDGDTVNLYSISASNYTEPSHYYRDLNENILEGNLNISVPMNLFGDNTSKFKFGTKIMAMDRDFNESIYKFRREPQLIYNGDPVSFFSDSLVGKVDERNGRNYFGNYITDQTQLGNNYTGTQDIAAFYAMTELAINKNLRIIGGARLESALIDVKSADSTKNSRIDSLGNVIELGIVDNTDILPAINAVYSLSDEMNLRVSYGRTLARPTFRELAPFPSFDFIGGFILNGNQELKRSLIDNYDFRWEWFMNPGEIIAFSVFYKQFDNPIEVAIVSNNNQIQYQNVPSATTTGFEFEYRFSLRYISDMMKNFSFGGNFTYVNSKVDIPEKDLQTKLTLDPNAETTRPLQGQSPYVVNLMLSYDNPKIGFESSLNFNMFGKRLSKVSLGGTPNVFEYSRPMLDFNSSYRILDYMSIKLRYGNILQSQFIEVIEYKERDDYYVTKYDLGSTISLGISFDF